MYDGASYVQFLENQAAGGSLGQEMHPHRKEGAEEREPANSRNTNFQIDTEKLREFQNNNHAYQRRNQKQLVSQFASNFANPNSRLGNHAAAEGHE